jgi:riboflavin transporter FmnP
VLPNGSPQVTVTVTFAEPLLFASMLSTVTKVAVLVLLPMVSALPLYRMVLCAQAIGEVSTRQAWMAALVQVLAGRSWA